LVVFAGPVAAKLDWDAINYANTNSEKHQVLFSTSVTVDGMEIPTGYKILLRSGDKDPGGSEAVFGRLFDRDGNPVFKFNETTGEPTSEKELSIDEDFSSILQIGDKLFMIVHFEFPNPAATYMVELNQTDNGELEVQSFKHISWTEFSGIWTPCAGSVTPWQTHLGSEEFGPDARLMEFTTIEGFRGVANDSFRSSEIRSISSFMRWYGKNPSNFTIEDLSLFKPYSYGYPWEGSVDVDGNVKVEKRFALGRTSVELPFVMPDNKTVYISDDGSNRVMTIFVADKENDLSSGELFAAKVTQIDNDGGGIFNMEWISLGKASDSELRDAAETTTFSDLFEAVTPNRNITRNNSGCPQGFTSINTHVDQECLKLKPGMEMFASRFETRRYSALLGATTEWSKMEGFSYSLKRRKAYIAISDVREGMEDFARKGEEETRFDEGGNNDIRLAYNPCGCVYEMDLDENLFAIQMTPLVCGIPDLTPGIPSIQVCDIDSIANPDNLAVVDDHDGIVIGEDTSFHQNDVIWYMDLKSRNLQRILSTPYGSETTSPYYYPNINGWAYIVAVVQHPYRESDMEKLLEPINTGNAGYVGYIGPIPSTGRNQ